MCTGAANEIQFENEARSSREVVQHSCYPHFQTPVIPISRRGKPAGHGRTRVWKSLRASPHIQKGGPRNGKGMLQNLLSKKKRLWRKPLEQVRTAVHSNRYRHPSLHGFLCARWRANRERPRRICYARCTRLCESVRLLVVVVGENGKMVLGLTHVRFRRTHHRPLSKFKHFTSSHATTCTIGNPTDSLTLYARGAVEGLPDDCRKVR